MFFMYLRIFILFIVSASAIDSDFTLPFEDTLGQDALSFDQMTLDSNPLDSSWDSTSLDSSSLDSTAPLFGADTSSTDDALNGFDLSDSSDFFSGDDPFQLADCSTSEIPSAVGKLRVKRADDGASCSNPSGTGDSNQPPLLIPQEYDPEHHSITCWELTLGFLPFAVASSGDGVDITRDGSTMTRIPSTRIQFTPSTLYRATIIIGVASFFTRDGQVYCCQNVQQFFTYTMGINCVGLWNIWDVGDSYRIPIKDFH